MDSKCQVEALHPLPGEMSRMCHRKGSRVRQCCQGDPLVGSFTTG